MQITSVSIYRYKVPLKKPLELPMRTLYRREGLLMRVASESGAVGWGEAAPLPGFSPERLQEATRQTFKLKRVMTGLKLDAESRNVNNLLQQVSNGEPLVPSVHYGLELALWSLLAETLDETLPRILNGSARETVSVNALMYGDKEEILTEAREAREQGYRAVKLKVGNNEIQEDIELVNAVSDVLGPNVELRLDANQAWDFEQATEFVKGIEDSNYSYLEEPIYRPKKLAQLVEETGARIALDESLVGTSPDQLGDYRYASAIVLKPSVIGGLARTRDFIQAAEEIGLQPVISSAFESGVGTMGLVALSSALGNEDIPAGLDAYAQLEQDVVRPRLKFENGLVDVPPMMSAKRTMNGHMLREV